MSGPFAEGNFYDTNKITRIEQEKTDCGVWAWTQQAEETHVAWGKKHQITPTSVRAVADTLDVTMKILFHSNYEPEWLRCTHPESRWRQPHGW